MKRLSFATNAAVWTAAAFLLGGCALFQGDLDSRKMNISSAPFGTTRSGQSVLLFTLCNARGHEVKITNYGGTIVSLSVPDKNGQQADVVQGFDTLRDYEERSPYFGCITGRYANRIARGKFFLDGVTYTLPVNNGPNHLHGGLSGFDKKVWASRTEKTPDSVRLVLHYTSPDGEEGYPGTLNCEVAYTWTNYDELRIDYTASTDRPTIVNLTNHSYFNLAGHDSGSVLNHYLTIHADAFTPADSTSIPYGEIRPVDGTPFDFRTPHTLGERINANDQQLKYGLGYDHNFVLNGAPGRLRKVAQLNERESGRIMVVETTEPGMQLYTANFLNNVRGKGGAVYQRRSAVCLETQHFPNSPNQPNFPSTVLLPGQKYRSTTVYRFLTEKKSE